MPRRWRPECLLLAVFLCGCGIQPDEPETVTSGEWIRSLVSRAGIAESNAKYDIAGVYADDDCYGAVQSAAAFGVLVSGETFDPAMTLTYGQAADTIVRLLALPDPGSQAKRIRAAADLGILAQKDPDQICQRQEAEEALDAAVEMLNHPEFKNEEIIEKDPQTEIIHMQPHRYSEADGTAEFPADCGLKAGDLVSWTEADRSERICVVEEVSPAENRDAVLLMPADPLMYTSSMQVSGEADLDFTDAEITAAAGTAAGIAPAALKPAGKLTVAGYDIDYTLSSSGVTAEVSRTLAHGEELFASLKLSGIHVKYSWKSAGDDVRGAFFTVSCHSQEDFGVRMESYRRYYGDLSALRPDDFLQSLRTMLQTASRTPVEIPVCTLRVPLEGTSTLSVKVQLVLKLYAGGRMQLTLSQDTLAGMEKRNGAFRLIHSYEHEENAGIRADFSVTGIIRFAFDFLRKSLMDAGVEAGAQCTGTTSFHLYEEDGTMRTVTEDLPYDAADELAQGNPDVLVCTDLNAYWVLNILLNSENSVLSRFGLNRTFRILGSGSSIFPGGKVHLENLQIVESCTRKERGKQPEMQEPVSSERILIDAYAKAVHLGSPAAVQIRALPDGYTMKDIEFVSSDPSVATADSSGLVTAHRSGSTEITVRTSDGKHTAVCSILVPVEEPA